MGITLSPQNVAGCNVGLPYGWSIVASGGVKPYSFAISDGALPAGLTLTYPDTPAYPAHDGHPGRPEIPYDGLHVVIAGTPTGPEQMYYFTLKATDSSPKPQSVSVDYFMDVGANPSEVD